MNSDDRGLADIVALAEMEYAGEFPPPPAEDWPALVPLDTPDLPHLELSHLPGWAGDFAGALSAEMETPPELAAGMVLATCAAAAARRLRIIVKPGYFEPCNLWTVVALPWTLGQHFQQYVDWSRKCI